MKTLFVIRHAKSSWDNPELDDIERPLNKRGKRDAPDMGQRLKKRGIYPDLIISSPANRALSTSKHIAEVLNYPHQSIQQEQKLYHASASSILKFIQQTDNSTCSLMIFGHNPGFTDFVNALVKTDIYNIPTCGVVSCTFDLNNWSEIEFGKGSLSFYDYPKKQLIKK